MNPGERVGTGKDAADGQEDDVDQRVFASALNARILEILEVLLKGSRSTAGHRLLLPAGDCDTSLSSQELYRIKLSQTTENRYFDASTSVPSSVPAVASWSN